MRWLSTIRRRWGLWCCKWLDRHALRDCDGPIMYVHGTCPRCGRYVTLTPGGKWRSELRPLDF